MRLIHTQSNFSAESGNAHVARGEAMATYILLANFTDQVIRKVKDHPGGRFDGPGRHVDGGLVMGN